MISKFSKFYLGASVALYSIVPTVHAAVPTYVSDALTAAETTLTEYMGAAAPKVLSAVAIVAALGLIVRLVKRALSGG
jgi:hypothetical protein